MEYKYITSCVYDVYTYIHIYVYKCAVGLDPSCTIHEVSMHAGCRGSHVLSIAAAGHLNNALI